MAERRGISSAVITDAMNSVRLAGAHPLWKKFVREEIGFTHCNLNLRYELNTIGKRTCLIQTENDRLFFPQEACLAAEAARAAFRKLRREIMFRFFIVVTPFPERAANQKTRSLCGTGLKTKRPCPCVLSTRTGSVNYDSAVPPCLLCIRYNRATHGEPTLPCPVTETSVQSY